MTIISGALIILSGILVIAYVLGGLVDTIHEDLKRIADAIEKKWSRQIGAKMFSTLLLIAVVLAGIFALWSGFSSSGETPKKILDYKNKKRKG